MMRTLLLAGAATLLATSAHAQIPNGGFENWTTMGPYMDPDNWITINALTALGASASCEQGTPGQVGSYFMKLTTRTITGIGTVPGVLVSGDAMTNVDGFPCTVRPEALTGKVKYTSVQGDMGVIAITLSKWNTVTNQRDVIGEGGFSATSSVTSWTNFAATINYTSSAYPDTASISILSGTSTAAEGSSIWVDNLGFGSAAGIDEANVAPIITLFPSPASDQVRVSADAPIAQATLVDMEGRTVSRVRASTNQVVLDVQALPAGLYAVELRMVDGRIARKRLMKD